MSAGPPGGSPAGTIGRRLAAVSAVAAVALAVAVLGCSRADREGGGPTSAVGSRSSPAEPPATTSAIPSATPPTDPDELPPAPQPTATGVGTLLGRAQSIGRGSVRLRSVPRLGSEVTLRLSCSGPGRVWITDRTGGEVMGTSGCQLGVIYSVGWHTTADDGRTIFIAVDPTTQWVVDVWLGLPPPSTTPAWDA